MQSLPAKSPAHKNSTDMRAILLNDALSNFSKKFRSNYIRTTKYTAISFLPLGIAYQFLRFSNCYFLLVVVLSCISLISPISPITAINPFVFVLVVSMIREGFEDYSRYKSDKTQNGQTVRIFKQGHSEAIEIQSKDLKIGDFVLIKDEETFPADLALLTSSNDGDCFIKTSSLDGEKNLKKRVQAKDLNVYFA